MGAGEIEDGKTPRSKLVNSRITEIFHRGLRHFRFIFTFIGHFKGSSVVKW